ncbi:MAG TPA: hypothetical protein VF555_05425 [Variovorax sp.]
MSSLEEVWAYREETLYPQLFGERHNGIYVLDHDDFGALGAESIDPRWLHLGVFEFEPTTTRTDSEKDWARAHSSEALVRLLEVHGGLPVTDPRRKTVA